jgi:hypothetical protein
MIRGKRITVLLPNLYPSTTLPSQQGRILQLIIETGREGINTLQLFQAGFMSAQNEISTLRKRGAKIQTCRKDALDNNGDIHQAVAHYTYLGWENSMEINHGF